MKDLINNNELTMSSREIAELTGKQLSHVHRDFKALSKELGFEAENELLMPGPNVDHGFYYELDERNRIKTIFLNRELTLTLVSGYSAKLRNTIIKRWGELENQQQQPALPANYIEALESLIESEKEKALLNEQLQEAAPKVEFVDKYVQASTGSKTFREVCKILKVKENVFRAFLVENKIMYKSSGGWLAHAQHINAGRFETKTGVKNEHSYTTTKFTGKGVEWIAGEYTKAAIREIGLH